MSSTESTPSPQGGETPHTTAGQNGPASPPAYAMADESEASPPAKAGPSAMETLEGRFRRRGALADAAGILQWDMETMMPPGAAAGRTEQLAVLEQLQHEILMAEDLATLFSQARVEAEAQAPVGDRAEAQADTELKPVESAAGPPNMRSQRNDSAVWRKANLGLMRKDWRAAQALPAELVDREVRISSAAQMAWRNARANSDFVAMQPHFEALFDVARDTGAALGEAFGLSPYDALLDRFSPGLRAVQLDALFGRVEQFLPEILARTLERQARERQPLRQREPVCATLQEQLGRQIMGAMGFDFERGRIDSSLHPFCGGASGDIRMTTRYDEHDVFSAQFGVIHETGHALYEAGRPAAWMHQPVGEALGMCVHESQSLIMEFQACRSPGFLGYFGTQVAKVLGTSDPALTDPDNLKRLATRVRPDFIRVDADEVTYPFHILLRYRLERAIMSGDLKVKDLPGEWERGMQHYLGITPPDHARGCLQDVHWPAALLGYFPAYSVGAMIAAQLWEAALARHPKIPADLAAGDFSTLVAWLRENVHQQGCLSDMDTLIENATGRPLDTDAFEAHLRGRYL